MELYIKKVNTAIVSGATYISDFTYRDNYVCMGYIISKTFYHNRRLHCEIFNTSTYELMYRKP